MGQNPRTVATLKEAKIAGQWRILVYMMISHRILSYSSPFSGPKRIYWKYLEILEYVHSNYIVGHHIGHMMSIMPLSSSNKKSEVVRHKSHILRTVALCWTQLVMILVFAEQSIFLLYVQVRNLFEEGESWVFQYFDGWLLVLTWCSVFCHVLSNGIIG